MEFNQEVVDFKGDKSLDLGPEILSWFCFGKFFWQVLLGVFSAVSMDSVML